LSLDLQAVQASEAAQKTPLLGRVVEARGSMLAPGEFCDGSMGESPISLCGSQPSVRHTEMAALFYSPIETAKLRG